MNDSAHPFCLPFFWLGGALALALVACGKNPPEPAGENPTPEPSSAATPAMKPSGPLASVLHPDLLEPSKASEKAPELFKAKFTTTRGDFVVEVHRDWSPLGADRFYNLVKMGFYDNTRFFRAIDGFMVQFGISGDPAVSAKWQTATIKDDSKAGQSNKRGTITFAKTGMPDSRTSQVFINLGDNARLDPSGFTPFGQVTQGMDVVDALYKGYGEGAPMGSGPNQALVQSQGNAYLDAKFPKLDGIRHAEIVK